jgi:head-tail adaptor
MRTTGVVAGRLPWVRAMGGLMSVVVLAACGSPTGKAPTPAAASGGASTTAHVTATGPVTPAQLASTLIAGAKSVTSAHISMSSTVGGQKVLSAEGDETLAGGKFTAMRLNETVLKVNLTILIVDRTVYVKMPAGANKGAKPWVKATVASKNPGLKQLATSISSLEQSTSPSQYGALTEVASSFKTIAVEQLNGVAVSHYSMLVDVSKVHNAAVTEAMTKALAQAGITKIPVEIWVDEQGRTVKAAERFKVQGQSLSVDMSMTRINQPVSIVAPPASQVSADSGVST